MTNRKRGRDASLAGHMREKQPGQTDLKDTKAANEDDAKNSSQSGIISKGTICDPNHKHKQPPHHEKHNKETWYDSVVNDVPVKPNNINCDPAENPKSNVSSFQPLAENCHLQIQDEK